MFNGYEEALKVINTSGELDNIRTAVDLYNVLLKCWCKDTCAPRLQEKWSDDNPTVGQCSVTAFLVQDIFGGEVYGMKTSSGIHCYNVVNGHIFDLTSEQFLEKASELVYDPSVDAKQLRIAAHHFKKEEKLQRYALLLSKVLSY